MDIGENTVADTLDGLQAGLVDTALAGVLPQGDAN